MRVKDALYLGFGAGAAWLIYRSAKGLDTTIDAVASPIGNALASISMWFNGNFDIKASSAGVLLYKDSLSNPEPGVYIMSAQRQESWAAMHQDNQRILDKILMPDGQVKPAYLGYLDNQIITLGDI